MSNSDGPSPPPMSPSLMSIKHSILFFQVICERNTCSHHSKLFIFISNLTSAFYSMIILSLYYNARFPSPTTQLSINSNHPSPLITTYPPGLHTVKCTLRENHYIFQSDPSLQSASQSSLNCIPPTFQTPSTSNPGCRQPTPGSYPCKSKACANTPQQPVLH